MAEADVEPAVAALTEGYARDSAAAGPAQATQALWRALQPLPLPIWQACARRLAQRGDFGAALTLLEQAIARAPESLALRYDFGSFLHLAGNHAQAEAALRPIVAQWPGDEAAFSLAEAQRSQGKLSAAAQTMVELMERVPADAERSRARLRFISQCQRETLAAELCGRELARGLDDLHLHIFAARMAVVLGRFEQARRHYFRAIELGADLNESFILQALSGTLRYPDAGHPDFALFEKHLRDPGLSPLGRASILFAQGKARDDVGDFKAAAAALRQANALVHAALPWSRQRWQAYVDGQIAARWPRDVVPADAACIPVFVVGLPRSGTTLVADRLARHPQVRNRGELALLPYLEKWLGNSGPPWEPGFLRHVARFGIAHLRQDDAPARWYIDKNPLNFRCIGLIGTLFPQARVIYCRRSLRDTALSIWSQFFARGEENGYAYDWADIAAFAAGCDTLMRHWQRVSPVPIHVVEYERMIERPEQTLAEMQAFLGLPAADLAAAEPPATAAIATSSAWQARQPIYTRSSGRWKAYAPFVPELEALFPDGSGGDPA